MSNRKHYLDNLRGLTILLLFPFHIFRIYDMWDDKFYIFGEELLIPSIFNSFLRFWIMPLLFAVAGLSSHYAMKKRNAGEYIKERVSKLLIPFISGLVLIVPIQPYLAALFRNGQANYLDSFTKLTDLSGYDGAFAVAHLWFLIFLFVISMICLPFIIWYKNKGKGTLGDKIPLIVVVLLGLLPCIVRSDLFKVIEIGGKSILEYSMYFLLGYFLLSNDNLLRKLEKHRFLLLVITVLYMGITTFILNSLFYEMASWLSILTMIGMAKRYLNFNGKITGYLSKSSFGVYLFHQSWIIVAAFLVFKFTGNPILQIPLIFILAVFLTYFTYEVCRRISVCRWIFGLKK